MTVSTFELIKQGTCLHPSHDIPAPVQARVLKTLDNIARYKERIQIAKAAGRPTKSYQTLLDSAERGLARIGKKYDISALLPKPAGVQLPSDVFATVTKTLGRIAEYEKRIKIARKAGRSTKSYETLLASAKRNLTKIGKKYDLSDVTGVPKDVTNLPALPTAKREAAIALRNRVFKLEKDLQAAIDAGIATRSRRALLDAAKRSLEKRFGGFDLSDLPPPSLVEDPIELLLRKYDAVIRRSQGRNMFQAFSPEADVRLRSVYEKIENYVSRNANRSLSRYTGDGYKTINTALKRGRSLSGPNRTVLRELEQLAKPLADNVPLVRGIDKQLDLKVGDTFQDASFSSTSRSLGIAHRFGKGTHNAGRTRKNTGTMFEIADAKGTRAIVTNPGELETIFLPGQKFRVLEAKTNVVMKRGAARANDLVADRYYLMVPE